MALLPQRGASLGERMHAVFVDLCHAGYRQVVLVGSDIPYPEGGFDQAGRARSWNSTGATWCSGPRTTAAIT